ncbi:hypothetical protein MHU86_7873 [Fragilaria crotonensis]|nr:hypothetical protein MHU86_7873 [Fragilaria crotonensis]
MSPSSDELFDTSRMVSQAKRGNLDEVRNLLRCSPNFDPKGDMVVGDTALNLASAYGHADVVRNEKGHVAVVRELLKLDKIHVNTGCSIGNTALIWATIIGHADVVRELTKRAELDGNLKNHAGSTALYLASKWGRLDMVYELSKGGNVADKNFALILACKRGHLKVVDELFKYFDVDVDSKCIKGNTPLICSSENGHLQVVIELLLFERLDVNAQNCFRCWRVRRVIGELLGSY